MIAIGCVTSSISAFVTSTLLSLSFSHIDPQLRSLSLFFLSFLLKRYKELLLLGRDLGSFSCWHQFLAIHNAAWQTVDPEINLNVTSPVLAFITAGRVYAKVAVPARAQ